MPYPERFLNKADLGILKPILKIHSYGFVKLGKKQNVKA